MLCSLVDSNTYAPLTAYDSTSSIIVISDEHWAIAGLNEGVSANSKDYATEYLTNSKTEFLSVH